MEQRVDMPGEEDLLRIEAQRNWVRNDFADDAIQKYSLLSEKLRLLQAILDAGWIEPSETAKLQSLGITLGDALAQELGMEWVMVEDEYGRDPAIRLPGTTVILFPLTMISKRVEKAEAVNVVELFNGVGDLARKVAADSGCRRH
jgi:Domain of unknown function (DUF3806)